MGQVQFNRSQRYTFADYLNWVDDKRYELLNGQVMELLQVKVGIFDGLVIDLKEIFDRK